jgi:hypothetical protein
MSAIITSKFRLDTTERFVDSLSTDTYYLGLGRPDPWLDSNGLVDENNPTVPVENDYTTNTAWESMYAMKKVDASDIIYAAPRNLWVSGTVYAEYDDRDTNIEGKQYYVITDNNNVFICLKSSGVSTTNPDLTGVQTSGIIDNSSTDGYIWKYLYTVPVDQASKFLTQSFIPVHYLSTQPDPGADTALINQWSVQDNAVNGAIYNFKVSAVGSGFVSAPVLTIKGDGTGAAATAVVDTTTGTLVSVTVTNAGSGYTKAVIEITGGSGSGAAVRPIIGPKGGFGADPRQDLRTHYIAINKVFNGTENGDIPSANDFRQISLVKNPVDASTSAVAATNAYTITRSLTVALGGSYAADECIIGTTTGAKGIVVEYDATNGVIYFVQNETTKFESFNSDTDLVRLCSATTGGQDITAVNAPEINHYSGDIVFLENRTPVSRGADQIETIRLVIAF